MHPSRQVYPLGAGIGVVINQGVKNVIITLPVDLLLLTEIQSHALAINYLPAPFPVPVVKRVVAARRKGEAEGGIRNLALEVGEVRLADVTARRCAIGILPACIYIRVLHPVGVRHPSFLHGEINIKLTRPHGPWVFMLLVKKVRAVSNSGRVDHVTFVCVYSLSVDFPISVGVTGRAVRAERLIESRLVVGTGNPAGSSRPRCDVVCG